MHATGPARWSAARAPSAPVSKRVRSCCVKLQLACCWRLTVVRGYAFHFVQGVVVDALGITNCVSCASWEVRRGVAGAGVCA